MPGRSATSSASSQLLAEPKSRATFFTLGWIAERYPALIRRIVDEGHELASHGYEHLRATRAGHRRVSRRHPPREGGARGHDRATRSRATARRAFRSGPTNPWAFDCIAEAGYRYSSSVYPIRHDHYGVPDAPRFAHEVRPGLLEVPVATVRMLNAQLAGRRRRLLPAAAVSVSRWSLRRVNASTASRRCSISIRGSSIPSSRASRARMPRRAFATT